MKGILGITREPLVSVDYKKNSHSSIIDGLSTAARGDMVRVLAWYDNEWAYAMRLIDTFRKMDHSQLEQPIRNNVPRAQ